MIYLKYRRYEMAEKLDFIMPLRLGSRDRRILKRASAAEDRSQAWLLRTALRKCYGDILEPKIPPKQD